MDFENLLEPEVAAAAAITAVIASPQVRNVLRRGAVFGLAGIIMAGDAVTSFARGVTRGVQSAAASATASAQPKPVPVQNENGTEPQPEHTEG